VKAVARKGTTKGIFGVLKRDPRKEEIKAALGQVRRSFNEFVRLRALNQRALHGDDKTCKISPQELQQRLKIMRDPEMEQRLRVKHYQLLQLIYQRDPSTEEMQVGIPTDDGLGLIPLLLAASPVVIGSAWGVHAITRYLTNVETGARAEEEARRQRQSVALRGVFALTGVGVLACGSYYLWKWVKNRPTAKELGKDTKPPELLEEPPEKDEEEDHEPS